MTLDRRAVARLLARAERDVDEGLVPSCQLAVGHHGETELFETFGVATSTSAYLTLSAVKPLTSMLVLDLIDQGVVDLSEPVCTYIPEFGSNDKHSVTVEHIMLHTCGFPRARITDTESRTSIGRRAAFASWRLDWAPGSRFTYHTEAAHWVLAELIEVHTGRDFRDAIHERVTAPLGLPRALGGSRRNLPLTVCGDEATPEESIAAFGVPTLSSPAITIDGVLRFDQVEVKSAGTPGGAGIMRADELVTFYNELLSGSRQVWSRSTLDTARFDIRNRFRDPSLGCTTLRTPAFVVAGGDGHANLRGFGRSASATTFGHNGAGGQIAWADPVSGVTFAYLTNGLDRNVVREPRRTTALSSLASACAS